MPIFHKRRGLRAARRVNAREGVNKNGMDAKSEQ